jgi:predicted double-glycine peptidase
MRLMRGLLLTGALSLACGLAPAQSAAAPADANTAASPGPEGVLLAAHSVSGFIPVKSWKTLRDHRIVKQDLDYSCGAASLATLLNSFYGQNLTEEALLKAMDKGDGRASFDDMARALTQFGFKAQGFAASWEQLARLKRPVIVYVKHRKDDHFSVLRGIDGDTVWLADPSLGNRTYSRAQFLSMWQTRQDKDDAALAGMFLAVLPGNPDIVSLGDFFTQAPRRQSANAVTQLMFRAPP